jgi:L-ribulose-5-phosphate 3-epimerase
MNTISFMTANYVARQVNYNMTQGWGEGETATIEYFKPIETFGTRFEEILTDVKALGFNAIDLWAAHLHPSWATEQHIAIAKALLEKHNISITSYAIWLSNMADLEKSCKVMVALNIPMIGGGGPLLDEHYSEVVKILRHYGVQYALENHVEPTPKEILNRIGNDADVVGVALDTGWFGTQGYPADDATRALLSRIKIVHLKDVRASGGHDTCLYGVGVVPVKACVEILKQANYSGALSIEHEPDHYDPSDEVVANANMVKDWLGK